jgi:hypoxanthine phosphoribosyltransferase
MKKIVKTEEELQEIIHNLGNVITNHYSRTPLSPVTVLICLKGAFVFAADLIRKLDFDLQVEFCQASSYINNKQTDSVNLVLPRLDEGSDILIIEDIIDSGETIKTLLKELEKFNPHSVQICTLVKAKNCPKDLNIDFVGFELQDEDFIAGYGLDDDKFDRNLPHIIKI